MGPVENPVNNKEYRIPGEAKEMLKSLASKWEDIDDANSLQTLSASDLHDPDISALIAAKMKEFHGLEMPGPKDVSLWHRLRNWLKTAKSLCTPEEAKDFRLDSIEDEISLIEKEFSGDQSIGFCHNDLQYGNVMIDEETRSITIIDYEYASYNPIAFDIANHFCEMTADYHTDTPHILDYSKYPGLEERQRFLHIYLSSSDGLPSDIELEQLLENVEKYKLASHLFWGLWGIISCMPFRNSGNCTHAFCIFTTDVL
ncbi:hypothetical protein D5086_000293 [Populus alba]|uniref:Uncharacterized protein n=1 Tax=Populus alba TaxID=43335 RepID=A0ACC4CWP7_POPAL